MPVLIFPFFFFFLFKTSESRKREKKKKEPELLRGNLGLSYLIRASMGCNQLVTLTKSGVQAKRIHVYSKKSK